ncbi:MAG: sterol desaturase family protein [Deltaproteobacteria bacterium]|nr:sterol desaturase family protein [Deltaproteobacteria bacterium]
MTDDQFMPGNDWGLIRLAIFFGGLGLFLLLELIAPYRPASVSKLSRWLINLGLAVFNTLALRLIFASAIVQTAVQVSHQRLGLLNMHPLPHWARILVTIIFLDFILYVWHLLNHEMPLMWRFHRVHHCDLNMDASTATRFHLGELAISAVIKIGLIFFLGADVWGVVWFEILVVFTAQFQHSSLKVPAWFEKIYWVLFVPPAMHRIHHSVVIKERNTNYGTIFSVWDWMLGTMLTRVDQGGIKIGVGAYPDARKLGLGQLLIMPFTRPAP